MKRGALVAAVAAAALVGVAPAGADFHSLCAAGSEPAATVSLTEPVNYSGFLTYRGTVKCVGASVNITSVTLTPVAGYPEKAGTASCTACTGAITVSGTSGATAWVYDVAMTFDVTASGQPTLSASRLGRYVVTWGGNVITLCPGFHAGPFDPYYGYVDLPTGDCPA